MIKISNNYRYALLIGWFVSLTTSCQPMILPNTLAPAKPYSAGNGEVGMRTIAYVPIGIDFKLGVTNNIQIGGIALGGIIYEGNVQINAEPSEQDKYWYVFGAGGGVYTAGDLQTNYIYQGYYPGFSLSNHSYISFPLRLYEFVGRYNCGRDSCPGRGAEPMERFQGAVFVPEMDWSHDWTHIGFRLGVSQPIQFWESSSPETIIILPDFSVGLYYKW